MTSMMQHKPTLDGREEHFHIRRLDNCVRVVASTSRPATSAYENLGPDFLEAQPQDGMHYISLQTLEPTGEIDEGQEVRDWQYVKGSAVGIGDRRKVFQVVTRYYNEAEEILTRLDKLPCKSTRSKKETASRDTAEVETPATHPVSEQQEHRNLRSHRGTRVNPWITFGSDCHTGIFLQVNGTVGYSLGGVEVEFDQWVIGIEKRGHIDQLHKALIFLLKEGWSDG